MKLKQPFKNKTELSKITNGLFVYVAVSENINPIRVTKSELNKSLKQSANVSGFAWTDSNNATVIFK